MGKSFKRKSVLAERTSVWRIIHLDRVHIEPLLPNPAALCVSSDVVYVDDEQRAIFQVTLEKDGVARGTRIGVYIDNRLNWDYHVKALKISFANKLNMLKRSLFLPRPMLLDLYFKVIYPSIIYGITVWGGLTNKEGLIALESLHCRAAKLIFNWPWDMPKSDVLSKARWSSIETTYKVNLAKLMFKIDKKTLPISILDTTEEVDVNTKKNLRSNANIKVPKFNTYYMKNSFSRRGPIVFNTLLQESNLRNITIKQLSSLAYKSKALLNLNFNSISPQTVNFKDPNFKYF